jgi:hypothetical protein
MATGAIGTGSAPSGDLGGNQNVPSDVNQIVPNLPKQSPMASAADNKENNMAVGMQNHAANLIGDLDCLAEGKEETTTERHIPETTMAGRLGVAIRCGTAFFALAYVIHELSQE